MLVLTRKLGERIFIGPNVCVTVVRVEGGQVRLGIEAPRHIPVVRSELVPPEPNERPAGAHPPRSPHPPPGPAGKRPVPG